MSSVAVPVSPSLPRPSAAELRRLIEAELADRIPGALTPHERVAPEMASSGIAALDELTGGWPRGTLSELFGPASSGRTSVLVAALAAATARGEACALVDAGDSFDPESAAAAGVDLKKLLWIRCGKNPPQSHRATEKLPNCRTAELPNFSKENVSEGHGFSRAEKTARRTPALAPEVRISKRIGSEDFGIPEPRDIGIWGYGDTETMERINPALAKKNPSQRHRDTEKKQILVCHSERSEKSAFQFGSSAIRQFGNRIPAPPRLRRENLPQRGKSRAAYARIEQALKSADLLLGAGGFGLVIIDLAGLPPEAARRVPLTTWFRFRRAVEATSTVLLAVSPQAITQSCAALSLKLQSSAVSCKPSAKAKLPVASCQLPDIPGSPDRIRGSPEQQFGNSAIRQFGNPSHAELLTGFRLRAEVVRSPLPARKRPHNTHAEIETHAQWA